MRWLISCLILLSTIPQFLVLPHGRRIRAEETKRMLQILVDEMWEADDEKPVGYILNWGNKCTGSICVSRAPLFAYVNEEIFRFRQYAALIAVFESEVFRANVCRVDDFSMNRKRELVREVYDAFTNTTVFLQALKFLQNIGEAEEWASFYSELYTFWFEPYVRCRGTMATSGFEHVFLGEWRGSKVSGLHNWLRYYHLEKSGAIRYHGYIEHLQDFSGTIQFSWKDRLKYIGGFNIATSPAFDFSIFTVCALTQPGTKACKFKVDGHQLIITTQTQRCDVGKCLTTAYPSALSSSRIGPSLLFVLGVMTILIFCYSI